MEQEAKELLRKRLDECLRAHADAINSNDIGSIYDIQQLAEIHFYLKTEHEFTAAEVEALLSYKDPLNVARWCWEENTHDHSFPICELLKEIHADDRFERVTQTSLLNEKYTELVKLLGRNFNDYRERLLNQDKDVLFDRAEEIAVAKAAYTYMTEYYSPHEDEVDFLLRYDDPLSLLCDYWPSGDFDGDMAIETIMNEMSTPPEERSEPPKSVLERLQNAERSVKDTAPIHTDKKKEAEI